MVIKGHITLYLRNKVLYSRPYVSKSERANIIKTWETIHEDGFILGSVYYVISPEYDENAKTINRSVVATDSSYNEIYFKSVQDAALQLKCRPEAVYRAISGITKTCRNYRIKYSTQAA